jgi:hypothetical protein
MCKGHHCAKRLEIDESPPEVWIAQPPMESVDEGVRPVPHRPRRADLECTRFDRTGSGVGLGSPAEVLSGESMRSPECGWMVL